MGELVNAKLPGGAHVVVDGGVAADGASLSAAFRLPGQESEADEVAKVAEVFPRLNVPDSRTFAIMGDPLARTVALDELVLRPDVLTTVDEVLSYLREDVVGDNGVEMLDITGGTGNGKTTIGRSIVEEAQAEDMFVLNVKPQDWLSGTRHTSAGNIRTALAQFAQSVSDGVAVGRPQKGIVFLNEAQGVFGDVSGDDELSQRAGAFTDVFDNLQTQHGIKLLFVLTGRLPLVADVADRAKWNLEMSNPNPGQRAQVLHHLLLREVDQDSRTSSKLDDNLLRAVIEFGTLNGEKNAQIQQYLSDRKKKVVQNVDPELAWAEGFYGLVQNTDGFSFRDMGKVVEKALDRIRRGDRKITFDDLSEVANRQQVEVNKRMAKEARERVS